MAAPENIKAGFLKEGDVFEENGIIHASPFVSLGDRRGGDEAAVDGLKDTFDLDLEETQRAVQAGFEALDKFNAETGDGAGKSLKLVREENQSRAFWF